MRIFRGSRLPGVGKSREITNLAFLAATNWLMNGQLTALNVFLWDIDDNVGDLATTNTYRYSRNVLFGVNAQWFIGQQRTLHRSIPAEPPAALQRVGVHLHVRNLDHDWTDEAAVA